MKFQPSDSLIQLQKIDAKMMENLVGIFDQHNIQYFIIAGSLLGAIRHKGFIPWDDDLDIGIPRPDYERFLVHKEEWLGEYYEAKNFRSDLKYKYYVTRVYDTRFQVKELRGNNKEITYASLDLFPIDGTPNNRIHRELFMNKIMFYRMLASLANFENIDQHRNRRKIEKIFINFMGHLHTERWLNKNIIYSHIDHLLKKQSYENSFYVGSLMGAYRKKEIFKKSFIGKRSKYRFENLDVFGPVNFDGYLSHMYGDYMKLPTLEQIKEKQHFEILTGENK